jgi:hypothetical protein
MNSNIYKRGFVGAVVGLIFILACIIGLYYLLFYKKTEYIAPPITPAQQATTSNSSLQTYASTVEGIFEERDTISFQFTYPKAAFVVEASTDGKQVTITENRTATTTVGTTTQMTATTTDHSLLITYEGGRGFMPEDYWKEEGKKMCADCVKSVAPFQIPNSETSLTYENNKKIVHIVKSPKDTSWLFIFQLEKPVGNVMNVLRTFEFK